MMGIPQYHCEECGKTLNPSTKGCGIEYNSEWFCDELCVARFKLIEAVSVRDEAVNFVLEHYGDSDYFDACESVINAEEQLKELEGDK